MQLGTGVVQIYCTIYKSNMFDHKYNLGFNMALGKIKKSAKGFQISNYKNLFCPCLGTFVKSLLLVGQIDII